MYHVTAEENINTPAAVPGAIAEFSDMEEAIRYAREHADEHHYGLAVVDEDGIDCQPDE